MSEQGASEDPPPIGSTWLDHDGDECQVIHVSGDVADLRYDDGSVWHTTWSDILRVRLS